MIFASFFASINHAALLQIISSYIPDQDIMWLLRNIVESFSTNQGGKGVPLGNLTSQLFCNVYMNEFDQFVKHKLKTKHYIRYADDFVFLSANKDWLIEISLEISEYLENNLKLTMHPDKVYIKTIASGVDFLGWIHFPKHRVLRTATKRRMFRRLSDHPTNEALQSYLGLIKPGKTYKIQQEVLNLYGLLNNL